MQGSQSKDETGRVKEMIFNTVSFEGTKKRGSSNIKAGSKRAGGMRCLL